MTILIIAFGIMALVGILTAIDSILNSMVTNFSGLGANSFQSPEKNADFEAIVEDSGEKPGKRN
ncbi:MAG: ABC transporter permease [Saprospiraceae bacterium]|nr:ABC transporter permease [Candidatus Parvibacillus calidus]